MPVTSEYIANTPTEPGITGDPLSTLLRRLRLSARVFLRADFCGDWAVDTSGERRAPFHLVTRGTGWLHQPGAAPQLMTAGDLVVFPSDTAHALSSSEAGPPYTRLNRPVEDPADLTEPVTSLLCGYFSFDRRAAAPLLDGLPGSIVLHLNEAAQHQNTGALVQLWMSEAAGQAPGCDAAIDQLAYVVFIHLLREQLARGAIKGPLLGLADARLGPVLNRIHADPGSIGSVGAMADMTSMSRSAFADRFKKVVGLTPGRYLGHWRMQLAIELLVDSDLPIASIAERCGYESEVAFRKAFRQSVGEPPGKFRRDGRGVPLDRFEFATE
jgi:AraC-like DNA-binding protein